MTLFILKTACVRLVIHNLYKGKFKDQIRPSSANERYLSFSGVKIMWSRSCISKNFPASFNFFVRSISDWLAVRFPEGWTMGNNDSGSTTF